MVNTMPKLRALKNRFSSLLYRGGKRNNAVAKRQYLEWRAAQVPPIPERCDNTACRFYLEPLLWNGSTLPLILEHFNGVNSDNRPKNLRLLCPNCDSQNLTTRGGANVGRVQKSSGGFALIDSQGTRHFVLPVESGHYTLTGNEVKLHGPDGTR